MHTLGAQASQAIINRHRGLTDFPQTERAYAGDTELDQASPPYDHPLNLLAELTQLYNHISDRHDELEKRARDLARKMHNTREMQDNLIEQIMVLNDQADHHRFQTETQGANVASVSGGGY